jgi:hypothetical protein
MTTKAKTKRVLLSGPSLEPQQLGETGNIWYYETRKCLELYVATQDDTLKIFLPWSKLLASAKRCRPEALGLAGRRVSK